jgi:RNA polymerase sigma-70 factor (ECF subfamily)
MEPSPSTQPFFSPTRWSLVLRARGPSPEARTALSDLCAAYWNPVFRHLRGFGIAEDEARELTQSFFAHLLSGDRINTADPAQGRFRSYLLVALRRFLKDRRLADSRMRRGGNIPHEPLETDSPAEPPASPAGPESARFDREWAMAVIARSLDAVAADYAASGRSSLFHQLKPWLEGPAGESSETTTALGLSEGALKVAVHRLRRRFKEAVLHEIRQTLPEDEDPQAELHYLIEVLSSAATAP